MMLPIRLVQTTSARFFKKNTIRINERQMLNESDRINDKFKKGISIILSLSELLSKPNFGKNIVTSFSSSARFCDKSHILTVAPTNFSQRESCQ
jgi:hypothetical protein